MDDTDKIQAWLDAGKPVPAGTYIITRPIIVRKRISGE